METPKGKRKPGSPRCRWADNIKMDLGEIEWGGVDWIGLGSGYGQVVGSYEFGNVSVGSIKCWETTEWLHN
jgi:hypothetical protein